MFKRMLSLLMALTVLLSLAACGGEAGQAEMTAPETTASEKEAVVETISQEDARKAEARAAIDAILPDSEFYFLSETEALAPYYAEAAARKEDILNSPTTIVKSDTFIRGETYTGMAYYISPNGNDNNDGLSPETAWKSPIHACWGDVKPGDAVFFERGSVFRLEAYGESYEIQLVDDVTYSAYGEGPKPVLTIAKENSAREECWQLYYEGENGAKIWKYYKPLGDVGGITFDDELGAKRVWEVPTPEGWLATEQIFYDPLDGSYYEIDPASLSGWETTDEYRSVEENLTEDMTYISRVDISGITYPYDFASEYREGELYLRCDTGNPGTLYEDIEIAAVSTDTRMAITRIFTTYESSGYVLDNLSIKYYLDSAVTTTLAASRDAVIQNCTVEWGGNRLHRVASAEEWGSIGDGIYNVSNNTVIRNNYLRQGNNGITFESSPGVPAPDNMGTYLAEGNLFEECWQGIRTYFHDENDWKKMEKLILRDNIILNSGIDFDFDNPETPVAIDIMHGLTAKEMEVSDNVIIGSRYALIRVPFDFGTPDVQINICDNVFAQDKNSPLICEGRWENGQNVWHMMENTN